MSAPRARQEPDPGLPPDFGKGDPFARDERIQKALWEIVKAAREMVADEHWTTHADRYGGIGKICKGHAIAVSKAGAALRDALTGLEIEQ